MNIISCNNNVDFAKYGNTIDKNLAETNQTVTSSLDNTNKSDSVEINQKNENIINKTKALNAFKESLSEVDDSAKDQIAAHFIVMQDVMKRSGINVPTFDINDNTNSTGFLSFIDTMKDFLNKENITSSVDKTSFLSFCDSFKEKLTKYNCR